MAYRYDTSGEIPARIAFAFALTALAIVFFAPLLPEETDAADRAGDDEQRVTLVEREGSGPGAAALGLTAVAAVPFLLRHSAFFKVAQRISAAVLVVGVLLSITTVGLFYLPSTLLMLLAATRHPPRDPFA